jgi:hypothetical protein
MADIESWLQMNYIILNVIQTIEIASFIII